jgi:DNA-binding transcriptional MerR regulator
MKKTLSIGEMSSLFQINVQTLHYYDSIGLFVPAERDPETGHRKYKFDQVYKLASIRYMRKLGYSLRQIKKYMDSNLDFKLDHLKEQSRVLRKKWEDLINIDTAIQRKISFIEKETTNIQLDQVTVKEFPQRKYIPIGEEEVLYGNEYFYFYPTIAFYEHDLKYFGAYLFYEENDEIEDIYVDTEEIAVSVIPAGKYFCCYHLGPYEKILETTQELRQSAASLKLAENSINFNIIDQFVEKDSEKYITEIQIPIME